MAFTEFCCRSGGSNLNAGTRTGNSTEPGTAAFKTYTSGTWVQSTRTFTPAGGANPTADGINVGDFVSIYPDAATVTPYVARIATVGSTTFVTDATAKSGTAPVDGTLVISASIGGAWKGPNGTETFPFGFITNTLTNSTGNFPRVNMKNNASYLITGAITHANTQTRFEGYTTAYADLGRATIDAQANAIVPLTISGTSCFLGSVIVTNNGASGTNAGIVMSGVDQTVFNCVSNAIRGHGISCTGSYVMVVECEAYACNGAGTSGSAGFNMATSVVSSCVRCISHDNVGANTHGFTGSAGINCIGCIADTNGGIGFNLANGSCLFHCDAYNNGSDGVRNNAGAHFTTVVDSCNCVSNTGNGINILGGFGLLLNCGFHNNVAQTSFSTFPISEIGSVTLGAVPYVDAPNGDFRINLAAAKGAGRGAFTETASGYAGTIGYPDIGAAQHLETASTSSIGVIGS